MIIVPPQIITTSNNQKLQLQQQHQQHLCYGRDYADGLGGLVSGGIAGYDQYCVREASLASDSHLPHTTTQLQQHPNNNTFTIMAQEDESRLTNSDLNEAASSSSKDVDPHQRDIGVDHHDEGWLQLSIGVGNTAISSSSSHHDIIDTSNVKHQNGHQVPVVLDHPAVARTEELMELNLLPAPAGSSSLHQNQGRPLITSPFFHFPPAEFSGGALPSSSSRPINVMMSGAGATSLGTSLFFQQHQFHLGGGGSSSSSIYPPHQHQEISWAFRPPVLLPPHSIAMEPSSSLASPSSSSPFFPSAASSLMSLQLQGPYNLSRPFQVLHSGLDESGPSSDFRVVDRPRRPHSGIWFMLQSSPNQSKEPFLPQISKSYLRIKDRRMTVRLLMKYLVNKLTLDNESEIEIRCRGQELQPDLTLEHVRDHIWSPTNDGDGDGLTLLPHSSTSDHLMVLHYARSAS